MIGISADQGRKYLASPTIQAAIKLAQKNLRESAAVTPEEVVCDLRLIRDMALGRVPVPETKWVDGEPVTRYVRQYNAGAANKAVENLGRVVAMFTDKKEIQVPATDDQLRRRLESLLGIPIEGEAEEVVEAQLDALAPPEGLSAMLEGHADDELTALLVAACDEQGI